jgi:hypothetical protein
VVSFSFEKPKIYAIQAKRVRVAEKLCEAQSHLDVDFSLVVKQVRCPARRDFEFLRQLVESDIQRSV